MVNKVAFFNSKGGCTKTTSIICVAGVLSSRGKVLVIDLDKQRNTTYTLLNQTDTDYSLTVFDFFEGSAELPEVVIPCKFADRGNPEPQYKNIDVVPGDVRLENQQLLQNVNIKEKLDKFIEQENYDWVLVDMPPSNQMINNICFQQIVDFLIIPFSCDIYSFLGYGDLMNDINEARQSNPDLAILGVFLARFMEKCKSDKMIGEQMVALGDLFINNSIPHSAEIKDVPLEGPLSFFVPRFANRWVSEKQLAVLQERNEIEEILKKENKLSKNAEKPKFFVRTQNPSLAAFERLVAIMESKIQEYREN